MQFRSQDSVCLSLVIFQSSSWPHLYFSKWHHVTNRSEHTCLSGCPILLRSSNLLIAVWNLETFWRCSLSGSAENVWTFRLPSFYITITFKPLLKSPIITCVTAALARVKAERPVVWQEEEYCASDEWPRTVAVIRSTVDRKLFEN